MYLSTCFDYGLDLYCKIGCCSQVCLNILKPDCYKYHVLITP